MFMNAKSNEYFQKYLDTKFKNVNNELKHITHMVKDLVDEFEKVKKDIKIALDGDEDHKGLRSRVRDLEKNYGNLKKAIVWAILILTPLYIKESRDFIVKIILSLI